MPSPAKSDSFRSDINALRALAVATVTLYHFNVPGLKAGFIGVDIFFVISGYLMTSIIVGGHEAGRFSLLAFYWSRARRIVPALVVLCGVLVLAGSLLMLPSDYRLLAKHVIGSLSFISNHVYAAESGYFDTASHDKWLLHTWSLSAEWQFYLLLPAFTMVMLKWLRVAALPAAFIVAALTSWAWCIHASVEQPSNAFYLLPSRAWEMLSGGLAFLWARPTVGTWSFKAVPAGRMAALGCALLVLSLVVLDPTAQWPGYLATLPVVGTVLILRANAGSAGWVNFRPIQALGSWSYSIYLWHWPLVVALGYAQIESHFGITSAAVLLSVVLGAISYRWIETPFRSVRLQAAAKTLVLPAGWVMCMLFAIAVYSTSGWPSRGLPEAAVLADQEKSNQQRLDQHGTQCAAPIDGTLPTCNYGTGTLGALVVGDSHSGALVTAVAEAAADRNEYVRHWGFTACPTVLEVTHHEKKFSACRTFNQAVVDEMSAVPISVPLILINRWPAYLEGPSSAEEGTGRRFITVGGSTAHEGFAQRFESALAGLVCPVVATGRRVIIVKAVPEMPFNVPNHMARAAMFTKQGRDVSISLAEHRARSGSSDALLDRVAKQCGTELLDPASTLCGNGRCTGSISGRPIYFDDDHLSEYGNKLLVPAFKRALHSPP